MYRGRFAPSPTGPLHFGSLIAAVTSYLEARTRHGQWLLRMEDLDRPREMPGAAAAILQALEAFGFEWDGAVIYQSQRDTAYAAALEKLKAAGLVYACACSRKEIADSAVHGIDGLIYPGTCRHGLPPGKTARAWRIKVDNRTIVFDDAVQGRISQHLGRDIGDFVLQRADGLYAYQRAVVVDDAEQGISNVVRGADLLDSTPRQIYLQQALGVPTPAYTHVPVAANRLGEKLSKQTLAQALDLGNPVGQLWQALRFLGQQPEPALQQATLAGLWDWAAAHWQLAAVPRQRMLPAPWGN
ncbi:MAG TPA: tRNA glutamyl-Q(34) synthetase GluQRS [Methylophilaceae bacterium]|nr:tRNA glutamyl-Q(34) synthetase GluQRS [Methylophilaceae bacterium]